MSTLEKAIVLLREMSEQSFTSESMEGFRVDTGAVLDILLYV